VAGFYFFLQSHGGKLQIRRMVLPFHLSRCTGKADVIWSSLYCNFTEISETNRELFCIPEGLIWSLDLDYYDSTTPDEAATVVEKEIYTQKCLGWINKRTHILKSMVDYESEQITLKLCVIWKSL
jgi:hypothetical protein